LEEKLKKKNILFLFTLILVLSIIVIPGCGSDPTSPATSDQQTVSSNSGPNESIEVHGHWKIEIQNPDGSIEGSYEFENELIGNERLAEFLAREFSVGAWMIGAGHHIIGDSPFYDPTNQNLNNEDGRIVEEAAGMPPSPWTFQNLTVSTNNSIVLTLEGMAIAQRDGSINVVKTYVSRLLATSPPTADLGQGFFPFTQQVISEIGVSAGQYIVFTVVISFS
jgi:hypothetical protein